MSTTADDWLEFFPPTSEGVRPDQEKAINFILDRIEDGVTNIFVEAPTGTGKSFMAWTVARACAAHRRWRTRILVPNVYLENQYTCDFGHLGTLQLESARHYKCQEFGSCDVGRGNEMVVVQQPEPVAVSEAGNPVNSTEHSEPAESVAVIRRAPKCHNPECSYLNARTAFERCAVGVSNTAYALTCAQFGHQFVSSDFLVVDEAHRLADQIADLYEVNIDCSLDPEGAPVGQEFEWLRSRYLPVLTNYLKTLRTEITRQGAPTATVNKLTAKFTRYSNEAASIAFIVSTPQEEWVISRPYGSIKVQPLWASRVAPRLLNFLAPRRLFMSGTFLDYGHHVAALGL